MKQSVITCVFAPTLRIEEIVLTCLYAVAKEFPDDDKFLGMDQASSRVEQYCRGAGWDIIKPLAGKPPRMRSLLQACLDRTQTELVWTVEHDCYVLPGRRDWISAKMEVLPKAAGISGFPVGDLRAATARTVDDLREVRNYVTLNCVCWRRAALAALPWADIPQFPSTDQHIGKHMLAAGWKLYYAVNQTVIHLAACARKELP